MERGRDQHADLGEDREFMDSAVRGRASYRTYLHHNVQYEELYFILRYTVRVRRDRPTARACLDGICLCAHILT